MRLQPFEGDPCCGSDRLLMQILRGEWGFNGIVVSDCGAIADFYNDRGHHTHPDAESASAAAVISGTDLECGSSYKALIESVKRINFRRDRRHVCQATDESPFCIGGNG